MSISTPPPPPPSGWSGRQLHRPRLPTGLADVRRGLGITKPAQYAAAGIPASWGVETESISLTAYTLAARSPMYTEVGTRGEGRIARLSQPAMTEIVIDDLVP